VILVQRIVKLTIAARIATVHIVQGIVKLIIAAKIVKVKIVLLGV